MTTGPEDRHGREVGLHDAVSLVEEFAATWERTIDSLVFPSPETFLQSADEQSQQELRATLNQLDAQFRQRLAERTFGQSAASSDAQTGGTGGASPGEQATPADDARPTSPNWQDPTLIAAVPAPADDGRGPVGAEPPDSEPAETAGPAVLDNPPAPDLDAQSAPGAGIGNRRLARTIDFSDGAAEVDAVSPTVAFPGPAKPPSRRRRLPDVPGYELEREIGRGGMGVVYRARQIGLNRTVALKMILAGEHASSEYLARFQTEAEAVAHLQHPNIVQVFDIGASDGLPYFSLEFVEGRSLEAERDGKPMDPRKAARLLVTMARAIHYAHEQGIVHRDLKPSNVLLAADGVPKIMDFGLAKRVEADSSRTKTGVVVGTPSYMPPEQAWGATTVGPLADVYALGATLYALLTGRPPFQGPNAVETILQVQRDEPVPPSRLQPSIPRDLETICLKALQKDPAARYADAAALADDLERYLRGEPILARPVSRVERIWRWCRRNPSLSISGGAALVLALCLMIGGPAAAAVIYRQKQDVDTARGKAEANALKAQENEQLARENAVTARKQRDLALSSLNTLAETAVGDLRDRPAMKRIREKFLLAAMKGLNQVADTGGDDDRKNLMLARTHRKMGDMLLETRLPQQAHDQYLRSHQIVLTMAKLGNRKKPEVPNLNLGRSFVNLGKAAERLGDAPKAKQYYLQSLAARREALKVAGDKLFVKQEIADACSHLGGVCRSQGRPQEALCWYRASLQFRKEWADAAPGNRSALQQLAGAQIGLAGLAVDQGRLGEAVEQYRAHLNTLQKLAKKHKNLVSPRGNVAFVHNQIGVALLFDNRPKEARAEFQQAVDIYKDLVQQDEENAVIRQKLGDALYGLAAACLAAHDAPAGAEHFASCLKIRRQLANKDPKDVALQGGLALALARAGKKDEAAALAGRIAERAAKDANQQYVVAGVYALCSDGAAANAGSDYAKRSVDTLAEAVRLGFKTRFLLQVDPDLAPVRARADFQKLLKQLPPQEKEDCPPEASPDFAAKAPGT